MQAGSPHACGAAGGAYVGRSPGSSAPSTLRHFGPKPLTHEGNFATGTLPRYIPHMAEPFRCYVCEQVENRCKCDRYCALCQGEHQVRLCQDGQYYCLECRESCDFQAQY